MALRGKKVKAFVWLFQAFLKCINGKHPGAIITDQDPAMYKVIAITFPTTHHWLCIWHILKKEFEKLGAIVHKKEFIEHFHSCLYSEGEFTSQ